jgi:hypothetical protein
MVVKAQIELEYSTSVINLHDGLNYHLANYHLVKPRLLLSSEMLKNLTEGLYAFRSYFVWLRGLEQGLLLALVTDEVIANCRVVGGLALQGLAVHSPGLLVPEKIKC